MHLPSQRLALFFALLLCAFLSARASSPVFLTGTGPADPYPDYSQSAYSTVPVGKTIVIPIAVSGTAPVAYSVTTSTPIVQPIIKTGYPVMNIHVTYAGITGSLDTLYTFTGGADGGSPYAGLIQARSGDFIGTTETDGTAGYGTVFRLAASGTTFNTLHTFTDGTDGANPYSGVVQAQNNDFYGTTGTGGAGGDGTVYQLTSTGTFTTLHAFSGNDGAFPYASLIQGLTGDLYGTTVNGGTYNEGTVFQVTTSGTFNTLYSFSGGADGSHPYGQLVQTTDGNFYGTTANGGTGDGTVFRLTVTGTGAMVSGSITTLHTFTGGSDGANPRAGLYLASEGNLYGTTLTGGTGGYGTLFETSTDAYDTLLPIYSFSGGSNGASPYAPLIEAPGGNFYGVTESGGASGHGTIFQVTNDSVTTLHSFDGGAEGGNPYGGLLLESGTLYGVNEAGGSGHGTVFALLPPGSFSGTMSFALLRDMAPVTAGYIAGFAEAGYYNGDDFFRIANLDTTGYSPAYIAQGGDPTETGTGGPGFTFNNEFNPALIFTGIGQLAMANAGDDTSTFRGTNSSQFFITQGPTRALDFGYTIFGQLVRGFDIMQDVMSVPVISGTTRPTSPVTMDSVTVSEDNTDAILLVSANGSVPNGATIKVSATQLAVGNPSGNTPVLNGSTPGLPFVISTYNDTVNDPPVIVPQASVTTLLHQKVSVPLQEQDLEFDELNPSYYPLSDSSNAGISFSGAHSVVITPNPASPLGSVDLGLYVSQFLSVERPDANDYTAVTVGLGTGKLTPVLTPFLSLTGSALNSGTSSLYATFLNSNPSRPPSDFTATINWGDGSPPVSGSNAVSVVNSPSYIPTEYAVSSTSSHVYSNPGIYPLNVTVTDTAGATLQVSNTAIVGPGPIFPIGRSITAPKGLINGIVATFVDNSPNVVPADYLSNINWGDGAITAGTIKGAAGNFQIYGKHQYAAGTTYPIDVTVHSAITSGSGFAWSTATLSGVPIRQPPFSQSHINATLGNPGYGRGYINEEITLQNSGNIASGPVTLYFYLSDTNLSDAGENPAIPAGAIRLKVGKYDGYQTISIPPGSYIQGSVSNIILPAGVPFDGKYILMQVVTSDPLAGHMDYPHVISAQYPLL